MVWLPSVNRFHIGTGPEIARRLQNAKIKAKTKDKMRQEGKEIRPEINMMHPKDETKFREMIEHYETQLVYLQAHIDHLEEQLESKPGEVYSLTR